MKQAPLKKSRFLPKPALVTITIAVFFAVGFVLLYQNIDHKATNTSTKGVAGKVSNHQDVDATVFWVGEPPDSDNHDITNVESAWVGNWVQEFGGADNPDNRCQWRPCAFVPKENAFYFALPFNDLDSSGNPKSASILQQIPWYPGHPAANGQSLVKNHWIAVTKDGKTAYAQWEDVGPFNEDDQAYVFGGKPSKARAGLDLSPATDDYIGGTGDDKVSWRFVDADQVPAGPWTTTVTTSGVSF